MKLPVFTKISTRSPPPLPSSVYKRSAGNGGQRCSFGLAGSSPSNLRLAPSLCTSSSSPCSHSARSQSHVAPTSGEFLLPSWKAHRKSSDQNNCLFLPFFFSPSRDFLPPLVTLLHERQFQKFSWPLVYIYCVQIFFASVFPILVGMFRRICGHATAYLLFLFELIMFTEAVKVIGKELRTFLERKMTFLNFEIFYFYFFEKGRGQTSQKWLRIEFVWNLFLELNLIKYIIHHGWYFWR